jgi:hypothetical protein
LAAIRCLTPSELRSQAAAVSRFGAARRLPRLPAKHLVVFTLVLQQIATNVIKHLIIPKPMLFWLQFMKANMTAKTISLRLSPDDYASATILANRKKLSINKLFIYGMKTLDRQEQEKRLFDDFTLIGDQIEVVEVEFGLAAQSEVVEKP